MGESLLLLQWCLAPKKTRAASARGKWLDAQHEKKTQKLFDLASLARKEAIQQLNNGNPKGSLDSLAKEVNHVPFNILIFSPMPRTSQG